MSDYVKGEEKKHFSFVVAALIVLATGIGFFIFSIISVDEKENLEEVLIDNDGGVIKVSPGPGLAVPTSEPNIEQPTVPPPG